MESYRKLGQEAVISVLPKRRIGTEVAVGPSIDHRTYLQTSNRGSHIDRFIDNSVYSTQIPGGGVEILTIPRSSYVEAPGSTHAMLVAIARDSRGRERSIPSFTDFSKEQGEIHFDLVGRLAGALSRRYAKRWFIGTSINPGEWRRQAVQSIKTVHTHAIGMRGEQFIPFSDVTDNGERLDRRRMLADSTTQLGIGLLRDLVFTLDFWETQRENAPFVVEKNVQLLTEYPKGYNFALKGLRSLKDPRFFALMKAIDERIKARYKDLANVLLVPGSRDELDRPVLRTPEERVRRLIPFARSNNLSFDTHRRLRALSSLARPANEEVAMAGKNEKDRIYRSNTRLFLIGRAYNLMVFPAQDSTDRIIVSVVPRGLSGGSPLDAMGIYKDQYLADPSVVDKVVARHKEVATEVALDAFGKADESLGEPIPGRIPAKA